MSDVIRVGLVAQWLRDFFSRPMFRVNVAEPKLRRPSRLGVVAKVEPKPEKVKPLVWFKRNQHSEDGAPYYESASQPAMHILCVPGRPKRYDLSIPSGGWQSFGTLVQAKRHAETLRTDL